MHDVLLSLTFLVLRLLNAIKFDNEELTNPISCLGTLCKFAKDSLEPIFPRQNRAVFLNLRSDSAD
jgi:hypothetical protein